MAVSVAVCEIFSVKEWRDLENRVRSRFVRVRSRSLEMAPLDRSPSIVTMAISCIVCTIERLICRKSRNFYTQPVFSTPARGDPVGISWRCLMLIKQNDWATVQWKNYDDMLSRFHLIPERNGQTDGWTDIFAISISRVSMLTRDKKLHQS